MNYRMIRYTLGLILLFEAVFFLLPMLIAVIYGEWQTLLSFLYAALIALGLGALASAKKPEKTSLYAKDGFVIVSLSWIVISVVGALPFIFSGAIPNFIDALFETVSGFTTTGATILTNIEILPKSLLTWRSFTHWVGGMGVLVFVMAILPLSGARNLHVMKAESTGPTVSKLVPRVRKTALILYAIYFSLTMLQFVLLLFDMNAFDALNTAFATAGTGGFAVKNDSMASYSVYIKIVVTVFMLLFSVNFNSYYLLLRTKFKEAFTSEVKTFFLIVFFAITFISIDVYISKSAGIVTFGSALLHSAFSVASIISTTGFATADFNLFPALSKVLLVLVMFIGACAGSTGGGIKVSRCQILRRGMSRELDNLIHPNQIKKVTIDKKAVEDEVVRSVYAYLVCYVAVFVTSLLLISIDNYEVTSGNALVTNFTAVAATLNNVGPGLDMVGPTGNFSFFSPLSKLVMIFDMLAGRLELLPMLLLFSPKTWKK